MRLTATLHNAQQGHKALLELWKHCKALLMAEHQLSVEIKTRTRSTDQNRLMWAMLGELSKQVVWHGQKLAADEWKDVLSASLKKQKVVPGIDGAFVVIGARTSQMTVSEMTDMIDLIGAFAAQQGVELKEEA